MTQQTNQIESSNKKKVIEYNVYDEQGFFYPIKGIQLLDNKFMITFDPNTRIKIFEPGYSPSVVDLGLGQDITKTNNVVKETVIQPPSNISYNGDDMNKVSTFMAYLQMESQDLIDKNIEVLKPLKDQYKKELESLNKKGCSSCQRNNLSKKYQAILINLTRENKLKL